MAVAGVLAALAGLVRMTRDDKQSDGADNERNVKTMPVCKLLNF